MSKEHSHRKYFQEDDPPVFNILSAWIKKNVTDLLNFKSGFLALYVLWQIIANKLGLLIHLQALHWQLIEFLLGKTILPG